MLDGAVKKPTARPRRRKKPFYKADEYHLTFIRPSSGEKFFYMVTRQLES